MKTVDIREKFLRFFEEKGHRRVPSSPLTADGDATLLFTNSGMVQFKDVFLGFDKRPYDKAVTAQRCLRAGGKHNDLDNVGYTARHHTFFEMLGNFSFGDYFKEKAIDYAWEFLTSPAWLGLEKEHIWITVFGGGSPFGDGDSAAAPADEEAATLWEKTLRAAGFDAEQARRRIRRVPTADNFWMMGETGPCGPCSEIFYDRDKAAAEFRGDSDGDACVEIWNLVFMQYNRAADGTLRALPAPCVDTGMGLERIAAVMQNVPGNYDTDMFARLRRDIAELIGADANVPPASLCVLADHIRAAAFLLADGVLPANEGRGYVLRRIIRRALRHLHNIRRNKARFADIAPPLIAAMEGAYPLLEEKREEIATALRREEDGFALLLKNGAAILAEEITALRRDGGTRLSGEAAFRLYDTYGFPPDLTAAMARDDYGVEVDEEGFERCMAAARHRSRAATKFKGGAEVVSYTGAPSEFCGYERLEDEAEISAILINGAAALVAREGTECVIVLNRTPFYAESGGQVGDRGQLLGGDGDSLARVVDTQKLRADVWGHAAVIEQGALRVGDAVRGKVDAPRRAAIRRNHSAAHLMHAALRAVLGRHVEQRGSLVSEKSARFDFSHPQATTADELREVETLVNRQIAKNAETRTEIMPHADAIRCGALALFGEKYGEMVRVVFLDEEFSVELCGGTHVRRAGDVGFFQIASESAIAAGVRRVEALTAESALERTQQTAARLSALAALLKTPEKELEGKITRLRESLRDSEKELTTLRAARTEETAARLAAEAEDKNGRRTLVRFVAGADGEELRALAPALVGRLRPAAAAVLLAGDGGGRACLAAAVAGDAGVHAGQWLRVAADAATAKGGGRSDFAQAGGGDTTKIDAALRAARQFLTTK